MSNLPCISVIIPVFNGARFIKNFFEELEKKTFQKKIEIIVVNDGSNDGSLKILRSLKLKNIKLYSIKKNSGPAKARNFGLNKATGEYVYFSDIDDRISIKAFEILYNQAKKYNCDYVCSDFERIENYQNQRKNKFNYSVSRTFNKSQIKKAMIKELHDPTLGHLGLFGCNGRLIKRSLIINNRITFCEKLRWLEDKVFSWCVLSHINKARYVKKQLYKYYVYPNLSSGVIEGLARQFKFNEIRIIMNYIRTCMKKKDFSALEIQSLYRQGIIFFSIQFLVSISRSIYLKKISRKKGKIIRKNFIKEILKRELVNSSIRKYKISKKESKFIPLAIKQRLLNSIEFACDNRASEVIKLRRKGKN